jgi:hypothetical protein
VIGESEEIVAFIFIPIYDHFRQVIAIAPQGMGVRVPLKPTTLLGPLDASVLRFTPFSVNNHENYGQQE